MYKLWIETTRGVVMSDKMIELPSTLVFCEDCKFLKSTSLKSAYTNGIHQYFCDHPSNKIPKDGWLRKKPLTKGPKDAPWVKNADNKCKDFEALRA